MGEYAIDRMYYSEPKKKAGKSIQEMLWEDIEGPSKSTTLLNLFGSNDTSCIAKSVMDDLGIDQLDVEYRRTGATEVQEIAITHPQTKKRVIYRAKMFQWQKRVMEA